MIDSAKSVVILVADDDPEDCLLIQDALQESRLTNDVRCVGDGEELLAYLEQRGKYADPLVSPRPALILLDLNMPRKDGREALAEIKGDRRFRKIPVVILTTSKAEEDISRSYALGVNSYITKPATFESLVEIMQALREYWFEVVQLPPLGTCDGAR